jgi:NAD(P)-dependent dehydrogenase (short-subunit alcohol dehydrogenase family)
MGRERRKMTDFSGKVVMITGAAGNLGRAVARTFQTTGAVLALLDRTSDRLEQLVDDFEMDEDRLFVIGVDLTNEADTNRAAADTYDKYGRIDVLINLAGGYRAGYTVEDTTNELWDYMLNLNARTVFLMSRSVIPFMKRRSEGKIINIGALAAQTGKPNMAAYSVSKNAVVRLTESMAEELRPSNIQVNALLPMNIDTPENRQQNPNADFSNWTKPKAIAEVILFLASQESRAVTGAAIPVRGGG